MDQKHQGALSELRAAAWLLSQGYEVFRNISPCGIIDIVAIKGDEILKLDIKTVPTLSYPARLKPDQKGVKILRIDRAGNCCIDHNPPFYSQDKISCHVCGKIFLPSKAAQRFCSSRCRNKHHQQAKSIEPVTYESLDLDGEG